jgi:holo-[acyl-carrier protein] synthase
MIVGTGVDIIEVERVSASMDRFGDRFLQRILLDSEIAYCRSHTQAAPHVAARFAATEAVRKAFGTGIGAKLGWHDIEIAREPSGAPFVRLHGKGLELLAERQARKLHISLSHTLVHAVATAILED